MLIKVHQLPRQPHSTGHSQDLSSCHSHYDMSVWWAMLREEIQISLGFLVGYCWLGWKAINQVAAEFTAMHPYVCLGFMCWALVKAANKIHRWNPPFHVLPFGMTTCDNDALKLVQGSCYPWYSCFWAWCIWQCGVSSLGWWSQTCHRTMSPARCGVMLAFNGTGAWRIYGSKYDSWWYDIGAQVWCKTVKKKSSEAIPSLNDYNVRAKIELPFGISQLLGTVIWVLARLWQKRKLLAMTRVQVHVLPIGHQAWLQAAKFPTCWGATWKNPRLSMGVVPEMRFSAKFFDSLCDFSSLWFVKVYLHENLGVRVSKVDKHGNKHLSTVSRWWFDWTRRVLPA